MADEGKGKRSSRPRMTELVRGAREQIEELTGHPVNSVLSVEREGDDGGGWDVTLELVELERVPETTNIMGAYQLKLDADGDVVQYRRVRRYHRGQPDEDG